MSEPNAAAAAAAAAHDSAVERALEAAAAAEASTAAVGGEATTMMDVELPALPPADGEGGMPPLDAVAAAAAEALTAAAAAPAQAVSFFAVRPPMGPTDAPSSLTNWGIFPTRSAAESYAASLASVSTAPADAGGVESFADAMSAIVYASRGTVVIGSQTKKKKKRKKSDGESAVSGFTAVYKGGAGGAASKTGRTYAPETKRRKPYKQWEDQYKKTAALKERTGDFKVTPDNYPSDLFPDEEVEVDDDNDDDVGAGGQKNKRSSADKLRRWMADQRHEYKLYQKGVKSGMTEEKIARLQSIGFDWDTAPLPIGRPKMADSGAAAASAGGSGRAPRGSLTEEERRKAKHMRKRPPKPLSAEKLAEWDRLYAEFLAFKEQNGHPNVNSQDKTELARWVAKQRHEYKLLKNDQHSNLTTSQLMKLQDAGFVFAPRGSSYLNWSDRMEQLRAFKAENGHLRIPVNHPELGSFIKSQRESHRRRTVGQPSNMTDERYNELLEIGFIFEAGKRHVVPRGPTKTWEQRFQDLLAYKMETGHCNVPQHYPGLGYWVHAQRNGYRMLKEGKKTAMTAEKALKLADAGFLFDAKKGKKKAGEIGGSVGDHHDHVGAGAANMNAAVGLAMAGHVHHHQANPPPLGGHLAAHHLTGYHYDGV